MFVHTPDDVLTHRLEVEHVVEGRGASHVGAVVVAGELGDLGDALLTEVAVLLLGEVQQRQHRRTRRGYSATTSSARWRMSVRKWLIGRPRP